MNNCLYITQTLTFLYLYMYIIYNLYVNICLSNSSDQYNFENNMYFLDII